MTWAFFFFLKISLNHVDRNLQKKEKVKKRKNSIIKRDKLIVRATKGSLLDLIFKERTKIKIKEK